MSGEGHYFPYIQNKQTHCRSHYAPKGAPRAADSFRSRCESDPGDSENTGISCPELFPKNWWHAFVHLIPV